jgi:hypothetical protein
MAHIWPTNGSLVEALPDFKNPISVENIVAPNFQLVSLIILTKS